MNITLVCEESFDGIMTAVYKAWILINEGHQVSIYPGENYSPTFFSEFIQIETDLEKAIKVAESIRVKISDKAYRMVYAACMHYEEDRADTVLGFLKMAYPIGAGATGMLGNPYVMRLLELKRKVFNEAHLFKEFIRFDKLKGGVLYGKIDPKCDVLPFVMQHFEARFPEENWIIYDEKRKKSAVHRNNLESFIVENQDMEELTKDLQTNDEYKDLWKIFFDTIGIDSRYNPVCQRNHMPKWYRKNVVEFK